MVDSNRARNLAALLLVAPMLLLAVPSDATRRGRDHGASSSSNGSKGHHWGWGWRFPKPSWHWGWGGGQGGSGWLQDCLCEILLAGGSDGWGATWAAQLGCELPDPEPDPEPDPDPVPEPEPEPEPEPDPEPPLPDFTLAAPPEATLLDAAGTPFADLGGLEIDHSFYRVPLASGLGDPVVILGPATGRGSDPGAARLERVQQDGFLLHFSEWEYLGGTHRMEAVSYLALAPGRHQLADGSEWEVGTLDVSGTGVWTSAGFGAAFDAPPQLFLTLQTFADDGMVVVRARDVTETGFQAALFEAEGADGVHDVERVGYLAVSSPAGSGRLDEAAGTLPYFARNVVAGDAPVPVLSARIRMEEEMAADAEEAHADEELSFMAIGAQVFAQDVSAADLDPAAPRRGAPEHGPVFEWGLLPEVDDGWLTVPLALAYTDPVVVAGPVSMQEADPAFARVRNVTPDSFEIRIDEWSYLDGIHGSESVFYMVADPGVQSLAGLMLEAGHVDTQVLLVDGTEPVTFPTPYTNVVGVPAVFASRMTENDPTPAVVRVTGRSDFGFDVALQHEEAILTTPHAAPETVGWIALQRGQVITPDARVVEVFDVGVGSTPEVVPFGPNFASRLPTVVGQLVSTIGTDPASLRQMALTRDEVTLFAEEEQSANDETGHYVEEVSVFSAD